MAQDDISSLNTDQIKTIVKKNDQMSKDITIALVTIDALGKTIDAFEKMLKKLEYKVESIEKKQYDLDMTTVKIDSEQIKKFDETISAVNDLKKLVEFGDKVKDRLLKIFITYIVYKLLSGFIGSEKIGWLIDVIK